MEYESSLEAREANTSATSNGLGNISFVTPHQTVFSSTVREAGFFSQRNRGRSLNRWAAQGNITQINKGGETDRSVRNKLFQTGRV